MSRLVPVLAGAMFPGLLVFGQTGPSTDPLAVIEKSVQAQGGMGNLLRATAGYRKVKGVFHSDNFKFTGESYSDASNRVKITLRGGDANFPEVRVMVIEDDGSGWASYDGAVFDFDAKLQKRMRKGSYADKVSGLVSLLRDKGYSLQFAGETKVKDAFAASVKVRYAGMPEITLYFDKVTRMLIKTAYIMEDLDTGKEFLQEVYYSQFEEFNPEADSLKTLAEAKQAVETPSLLAFLKARIPTKETLKEIDLLIIELGRSAFSAREKASAALAKIGPVAAGPLRLAAKSPDLEVARRADQLLQKLAPTDSFLATAVVRVLAARKPDGAVEALAEYLPSAIDETVVKEVKFALVSLIEGNDKARRVVEAMVKDDNPQRQAAAKAILGEDEGKFLKEPGRRVVVHNLRMARHAEVFRDGVPYFEMETFHHTFYNGFDNALFKRP